MMMMHTCINPHMDTVFGADLLNSVGPGPYISKYRNTYAGVMRVYLLDSVGSCFWMSSDAKMGSRYIQLRWHASHCNSARVHVTA
jgi:hypothetical protein